MCFFDNNAYSKAVHSKSTIDDRSDLFFDRRIDNLAFSYSHVDYSDFKKSYSPKGWIGRKFLALPAALWCGVVKTIFHIAIAILVKNTTSYRVDSEYLKTRIFYVFRDLQETYGWLTTLLVGDRYGRYHIEQSRFEKACYDNFLFYNPDNINDLLYSQRERSNVEEFLGLEDLDRDRLTPTSPQIQSSESNGFREVVEERDFDELLGLGDLGGPSLGCQIPISRSQPRESSHSRLVDRINYHLSRNNLKKAAEEIDKLTNGPTKESLTANLANRYFDKGDLKNAFTAINRYYIEDQMKQSFMVRIANKYLENDDLKNALEIINQYYIEDQIKRSFIIEAARFYFKNDDLEKVFNIIDTYRFFLDNQTFETFLDNIANRFLEMDDLSNVSWMMNLIGNYYSDIESKTTHSLFGKLIEHYLKQNDLDNVFKTINRFYFMFDDRVLGIFNRKIICYLEKNITNLDLETTLARLTSANLELGYKLLPDLALLYYRKNDENSVVKIVEVMVKNFFRTVCSLDEQSVLNYRMIISEIMSQEKTCRAIRDFLPQLSRWCYLKSEKHFKEDNVQEVLNIIEKEIFGSQLSLSPLDVFFSFLNPEPFMKSYGILGLKTTASYQEVKKAYKRLAKSSHPDRFPEKEKQFKTIQGAYDTISSCYCCC